MTGGMLRRQMVNPQVRTAAQITAAPFEAVYPQTEGLSSTVIAKCIRQLLPHAELLPDPLPEEMLKKYRLLSKADAVRAIHCPATEEEAFAARRRLIYEELLVLQLGIGRMKNRGSASTGAPMQRLDPAPFWASLPFSPTGAQRLALIHILALTGEEHGNRIIRDGFLFGTALLLRQIIQDLAAAGLGVLFGHIVQLIDDDAADAGRLCQNIVQVGNVLFQLFDLTRPLEDILPVQVTQLDLSHIVSLHPVSYTHLGEYFLSCP